MTLEELEAVIAMRAKADPDQSWTAKLLSKGEHKVAEKFGEEAVECLIEAVRGDREQLKKEAADVLFHLLVMLKSRDVSVADVMSELESRQNQSGISEKASRSTET